ncbi:FHA domain-containing protein [Nocardia sp. NPDC050408]|uniref:FHA domain-containing protein n=1 Tax=Nocardia sp. NPDC050408 TaxID=3364319 RepID=UPI0037A80B05
MDASGLLVEVPSAVRDLVLGQWPRTQVGGMRCNGDAYMLAHREITACADRYEAEAPRTEQAVSGETRTGMAERHRTVLQAMRDKAAVCKSMGQQCYDVADSTVQVQHLLVATGIALGAQLAFDMLLFFQGGGAKALADRLEAEEEMRMMTARFTTEVGEHAAAGQAERSALHGAVHAAAIGGLTGALTSAGAQVWDLIDGVRDEFDVGSMVELAVGGALGGAAGAEVGRRVAPRVLDRLSGRATTTAGRLAMHMGGTVLIGGAGGLGGGIVGALPSVALHYKDIHSIGDVFEIVRSAAITGFAGGFLGAATSSLRVHQAGRNAFRRDDGTSRLALRQREFATHINELLRSGEAPRVETIARTSMLDDSAKLVERLTFHDGTQVIHKVVSNPRHAHAEFLVSLVGDAVGARVPAVHVIGEHVYMEVVPGKTGQDAYPRDWEAEGRFFGTPSGKRLGILDVLIAMPDRNSENWIVDRSGQVWAIDNSRAFEGGVDAEVISPFAKQFQEYHLITEINWKDHDFTQTEVHEIRQRIEELQPAFLAAGRRSWHDAMLHRLNIFEQHAVDYVGPRQASDQRSVSPLVVGESPVRAPESNGRRPVDGRDVSAGPRGARDRPGAHDLNQGLPGAPASHAPVDADAPEPPPVHRDADDPVVREEGTQDEEPSPHVDEPSYDGPPTRPQPRVDLEDRPANDDDLHAAAKPPGATAFYHHPDGGYVDVVLTGADGARVPLRLIPGQEYVLGRGEGALLDNMATDVVSRRHLTIRVDDRGHVFIRDNGSLNGTFVDGKQLVGHQWVRIFDGQDLILGRNFELGVAFERQMAEVRLFGDDGQAFRLYRGQTIDIGRYDLPPDTPGADVVSRRHATIGMDENGRVWIQDAGSTNGTRVNGDRLVDGEQRTLRPGDAVQFGRGDSERLAGYRGEVQFVAPDGATATDPVRVLLGSGPNATPVRLGPGHTVVVGTDASSPFAEQLIGVAGVDARHATLGLDHDGRLWIRDHEGSAGVWVNGDRVAPNQKVTLTEGDRVRLGPEFVGTAQIGAGEHTALPPVVLHFPPDRSRTPIHLEPGQERIINVDEINGNVIEFDLKRGVMNGHEATFGRDLDGRVWVRDPGPEGAVRTKVNDETIPANEKRYLDNDDKLTFDRVSARVAVGEESPLEVRLSDDADAPAVRLRRGEEVKLGRSLDSPMAEQLSDLSVSRHHATMYRDEYGNLWLRDEHSTRGTWVNGKRVDPDAGPVQLHPGDMIRMGEWMGSAQYGDGSREPAPQVVPVKLNSPHGELSLDLIRGGEPELLGRSNSRVPTSLRRYDFISDRHASVGVHPSGRVWIRDEGSTNGTYVNGKRIKSGTTVTLHPGDQVGLAKDAYEFTVAFTPAEGGPFINIIDSMPESRRVVKDLALIPDHVFQRVSDHINASPDGAIVIGKKPVKEMPGLEQVVRDNPEGPNDRVKWHRVAGLYSGGPRRIYVDSNYGKDFFPGAVAWHEFGHAADAAYGTGGHWLSDGNEWKDLHAEMLAAIGSHSDWDHYADTPREGFADAFSAWVAGGPKNMQQLRKFACGNKRIADKLEEYFARVLT